MNAMRNTRRYSTLAMAREVAARQTYNVPVLLGEGAAARAGGRVMRGLMMQVTLCVPDGVTDSEVKNYVHDAIVSHSGGMDPGDSLYGAFKGDGMVTVKVDRKTVVRVTRRYNEYHPEKGG